MADNSGNQEFIVLNWDEVVEIDANVGTYLALNSNNFKYLHMIISNLQSAIISRVDIRDEKIKNQLFYDDYDGVECEVLRLGVQSWQKGKIKVELTVKFYPDESEEEIEENEAENSGDNNSEELENEVSPLDDLRQKFNQENK
ncbi:MAG: hypothetical protein F6K23_17125 [Okeania sp. SIO2C9]|uniref:KGK domain-containing protein n=1 Tax=Okeania sp. SIO2C9 TaxID=2607791 RepID=UPI0013C01415|nr:KGK domain-containing protein [Okeania sp. SIO2C9]NEQ74610.1 hypothetical protein [Okeania sp. SIO2C9]